MQDNTVQADLKKRVNQMLLEQKINMLELKKEKVFNYHHSTRIQWLESLMKN